MTDRRGFAASGRDQNWEVTLVKTLINMTKPLSNTQGLIAKELNVSVYFLVQHNATMPSSYVEFLTAVKVFFFISFLSI